MPRPGRVFFDGAVYHVYNRVTRGEPVFSDEDAARRFVGLLREVMERDGVTVFAWTLMSNHYHLAVRTGPVSLDRPMRSLQQRFTRHFNTHHQLFGPLWQGRYRAKLVEHQAHLDQLLAYIHLNPVAGGLVDDPIEYPWSGHREILGKTKGSLVDVDEVLRVFGTTRRAARAAYVRAIKGTVTEEWFGEIPGHLPWWRLGRPPASEDEDPQLAARAMTKDRQQVGGRPHLAAADFLQRGAELLGLDFEVMQSRTRRSEIARARELLTTLGVERYGFRVNELALALEKHPVTASGWVMRGVHRRCTEQEFSARLDEVDAAIAG
jgi:REP element-mobilizing transposase RayT